MAHITDETLNAELQALEALRQAAEPGTTAAARDSCLETAFGAIRDSERFRVAVMTALTSALENDAASVVGMAHEIAVTLSRAVLLDVLATRAMVDYGCMPLRSGRIVRWYSGQLGAGMFSQDPPIPFERNKPITVRALPGIRLVAFVELADRGEPPLPPCVRHAHLGYGKQRTYVMQFGESPR